MKLSKIQAGLIPITISTVTLTSNIDVQTFKYNDLNENRIQISDKDILSHLNTSQKNTYNQLLIKIKFTELYNKWIKKTAFLSSPNKIIDDINFKEIVNLGELVVPYIIDKLETEPSYLVWSLNIIFGKRISNDPSTTIIEASRMWVKYLKS